MAVKTETRGTAAFLVSEAAGDRSRETVTVASSATKGDVKVGSVLGKITSGGKYALFDNGVSDGTETAVAVSLQDCDATAADASCVVISREAEVNTNELQWFDKTNDAAGGITELETRSIIARS